MKKEELIKGKQYILKRKNWIVEFTGLRNKDGLVILAPVSNEACQKFLGYDHVDEMIDPNNAEGCFGLPEDAFLSVFEPMN